MTAFHVCDQTPSEFPYLAFLLTLTMTVFLILACHSCRVLDILTFFYGFALKFILYPDCHFFLLYWIISTIKRILFTPFLPSSTTLITKKNYQKTMYNSNLFLLIFHSLLNWLQKELSLLFCWISFANCHEVKLC